MMMLRMGWAGARSGVEALIAAQPVERILDAGCGSRRMIKLPDVHVTGIDIDPQALSEEHLDQAILGDIQTYPFDADRFDVIVSAFVLEHVPDPATAIVNLAGALRPDGGLLVLAIPNPKSVTGLITKYSPHWIHVQWYKLNGFADAGQPGKHPFPVYMDWSLSRDKLQQLADRLGLEIVYDVPYESGGQAMVRDRLRVTGGLWKLVIWVARRFSLEAEATDRVIAFRR